MLNFNFDPFPELHSERLHLRRMLESDAADFFEMRSDAEVMKYIARPLAKTPADSLKLILNMNEGIARNEMINWGIALKGENKVIGTIGYYRAKPEHYRAEIGYLLHRQFQKQGFMQEAIEMVIKYGFKELGLHSIEAVIDPRNLDSEKILLKNNFVKEAHFREDFYWEGEFQDSAHYSLLAAAHTRN
jgi:ribosomal-protein-alanine N-acetyltransferase